jgi:hypothetical protein
MGQNIGETHRFFGTSCHSYLSLSLGVTQMHHPFLSLLPDRILDLIFPDLFNIQDAFPETASAHKSRRNKTTSPNSQIPR